MKFWNVAFFGSALLIAGSLLAALDQQDKKLTEAIKSGDKALYCTFSDGERQIDKDKFLKVEEFDGVLVFKFTNGSARNCTVEDVK